MCTICPSFRSHGSRFHKRLLTSLPEALLYQFEKSTAVLFRPSPVVLYIEDFFFYKSFTGCFLIKHKYAPVYGCILTAIVCTRIQVHFRRTAICVHEKHKPGYPTQTYRYRFTRSSRLWLRHPCRTCKPIFSWLLPPQFPTGSPCLYVSEEKPGVRYHGSREIYFHAK